MSARETTKRIGIIASALAGSGLIGAVVQSKIIDPPMSKRDLEYSLTVSANKIIEMIEAKRIAETKDLLDQLEKRFSLFEQRFVQIASDQRLTDTRIDAIRDRLTRVDVMASDIAWIRETVNEIKTDRKDRGG